MKNISFKRFIVILAVALTLLSAAFLAYVADTVAKYNDNLLDNYMAAFIQNLKDTGFAIPISGTEDMQKSEFDKSDASIRKGLAYLAEKDSLTFRQSSGSNDADNPSFDIYNGDTPLIRVTLFAKDHLTRLGRFSFDIWDVKEVRLLKANGLYDYEISVPNYCIVEVNGRTLTEQESPDSTLLTGLSDISRKSGLSYQVNYQIKGLIDAIDIKVTDRNGKPVQCETTGTHCFKPLECEKVSDEATAKTKIKNFPDILHIAREWSLYMSHDQHGGRQGFDNIEDFLIKGTYLYIYSLRWSGSVDITYVSNHGWDKERFSNEKVCNFEIYSDTDFACDVFLQKNLVVHEKLPEKMAERMHFLYYDDTDDGKDNPSWKIVSMMSLPKL